MAAVQSNGILGLGTDLVEIDRLEESIRRTGDVFLQHVYAPEELAAAPEKGRRRMEFFAGRWAAKEALSKALGTGIGEKCAMQEICVLNDDAGRPVMTLTGNAKATAAERGVSRIWLTLSHEQHYAVATVILC